MTPGKIVLTTVLTVFTLIAFASVAATAFFPFAVEAHGMRGHGGATSDRHERMLQHCKRMGPAHTRVIEAAVSAALDLDNAQEDALQPVIGVLDNLRETAVSTCDNLQIDSVDGGLAAMQQMLGASADAIAELRPAYANFEASLNDEQKAHVAEMIARHHSR